MIARNEHTSDPAWGNPAAHAQSLPTCLNPLGALKAITATGQLPPNHDPAMIGWNAPKSAIPRDPDRKRLDQLEAVIPRRCRD
jgi:hypothetical protein